MALISTLNLISFETNGTIFSTNSVKTKLDLKSSFNKIVNPEPMNFSIIMIFVLVFSIVVKIWLSYFNGKII